MAVLFSCLRVLYSPLTAVSGLIPKGSTSNFLVLVNSFSVNGNRKVRSRAFSFPLIYLRTTGTKKSDYELFRSRRFRKSVLSRKINLLWAQLGQRELVYVRVDDVETVVVQRVLAVVVKSASLV